MDHKTIDELRKEIESGRRGFARKDEIQVWACKTKSCDAFGMWTSKVICPYCGGQNARA